MKKLRKILAILAAAIVAAFGAFSMPLASVSAETTETSSVLEDIQTDVAFSADNYPAMTVDEMKAAKQAELEVIKIAESADDRLYIYVYQPTDPTKEIVATYLLIGQTESENAARVLPLSLVSTDGVFDKYLVDGLQVMSSLSERFYQITSIFRAFDKELDAETGNDNKESNIAVGVAQTWHARAAEGGKIEYGYTKDDVITVTDEWHGSIRYSDGMGFLAAPYTDSHFIAFTTDRVIEELKSAVVYYKKTYEVRDTCALCINAGYHYSKIVEKKVYAAEDVRVEADKKGGNAADHWFAHEYTWDRIGTVENFISSNSEHLTQTAKNNLQEVIENAGNNGAFVLRYLETSYEMDGTGGAWHWQGVLLHTTTARSKGFKIEDVAILKLTFETKGVPYTMGVIDSMTTSDNIPDGEYTFLDGVLANLKDGWNEFQRILRIIGLVLGAVVVAFAVFGIIKLIVLLRDAFGKRGSGRGGGDGNAGGASPGSPGGT